MMLFKLQPAELENGTTPKAYLVDKIGLVKNKENYKLKPALLVGFSKEEKAGKIDLETRDFIKNTKRAVGMYPVFSTINGNWYTEYNKIESVKTISKLEEIEEKETQEIEE